MIKGTHFDNLYDDTFIHQSTERFASDMAKYVSRRRASVSYVKPNRSASVDHLPVLTTSGTSVEMTSAIPNGSPSGDRDGVTLNDIVTALDSSDDEDEHEHINVSVHDKVEETSLRDGEATSSRIKMTAALPTPPVYSLWSEEKLSSSCSSTTTKCAFSRNGKFIATSGVDASLVSPR